MRTTISIEEHLLRKAKEQAAATDRSLSAFIADALREVLSRRTRSDHPGPIHLITVRGELIPGVNYDSFAELNDRAEGPG